ncbi:inositol-tetrakisphosphate 1-kinase 1-like [Setaria viridis]|uniref:inositol-tetrakisphosphate 1-kinase 1-like n=1 Tax=Setaria viridis TaxID=4556 RepID=UPI001493AE6F|nr:inositol-tetrakisphosphate 1-kinase 1-like [Setaria viridis]
MRNDNIALPSSCTLPFPVVFLISSLISTVGLLVEPPAEHRCLRPLAEQGPFHLLIHKLYSDDWCAHLEAFAARHPTVPVVDPPHAIDRLHNRISMLQVVSDLDHAADKDRTFSIPSQVIVYDAATLADSGLLAALRFPLIPKPLVADGTAKSHKMSLVYHREGLGKLRPPLMLQEFVNHNGAIFKVYGGGGHVTCVKRRSLPDVSPEDDAFAEGSVSFSQVSNLPRRRSCAGLDGGGEDRGRRCRT